MLIYRDKLAMDGIQSVLKAQGLDIDQANRYMRLTLFDSLRIAQASKELEEEAKRKKKKK